MELHQTHKSETFKGPQLRGARLGEKYRGGSQTYDCHPSI